MAKEKNSFIVYYDFEEQTATLSDQQVGRLIRVMLDYEKRGVLPDGEDTLVGMAFWFLKVGLDLNDEKYRKVCERNKANHNGGKCALSEGPEVGEEPFRRSELDVPFEVSDPSYF